MKGPTAFRVCRWYGIRLWQGVSECYKQQVTNTYARYAGKGRSYLEGHLDRLSIRRWSLVQHSRVAEVKGSRQRLARLKIDGTGAKLVGVENEKLCSSIRVLEQAVGCLRWRRPRPFGPEGGPRGHWSRYQRSRTASGGQGMNLGDQELACKVRLEVEGQPS
jgi:hypothetical protein